MKFVLAAAVVLLAYIFIRTSCPTVFIGDSGEMISAAVTLGIGHPPGYPLYMLCAKIFSYLPAGDIAYRINLMSAFLAVLVFLTLYFTALLLLKIIFGGKYNNEMKFAAVFSALIFSFSYMTWFMSLHSKGGVYLMAHFAGLLAILFSLKFINERKSGYFLAASYLAGFLPALHYSFGLVMLFVLAALVLNMKKVSLKHKITGVSLFFLSFLTSYLYLFIRAKAGAAVCWGSIATVEQVLSHILRKVYSFAPAGPFTADVVLFKIKHYIGQFSYSYKAAALLSGAGFVFIFLKSKKIFFILLAFITTNLAALFYLTGYSFSPFNVYMNSGFYIVVDVALVFAAAAGAYGFLIVADRKHTLLKNTAAVLMLVMLSYNIRSFFQPNDQSRKFMAYDNTMNNFKTLDKGDRIFAEEDFQVFNILYFKQVRKMFPDIAAYDRSANFLDTSIFTAFKDAAMEQKFSVRAKNKKELDYMMAQYTRKLERAAEFKVIAENPGKVYYTGMMEFEAMGFVPGLYGILYKAVKKDLPPTDGEVLMRLYTIRDFYNNKMLDLYYRDVIARYFVQYAKYAAIKKDYARFNFYREAAEKTAGLSGPVLNLIAEIYYTDFKNMAKAVEYMERIMHINPYDYAALDVLIRFCLVSDREKALNWLNHYYIISTSNEMQNAVLVRINKLKEEMKNN